MLKTLSIKTKSQTSMVEITQEIKNIITSSKIGNGICTIFVPHTTAAVTINENADPTVQEDMLKEVNKIVPFHDNYKHMEGNSAAHIKASFFGSSENIIIENNSLLLGMWQGIYFCEFDGPRNRNLHIKIISV